MNAQRLKRPNTRYGCAYLNATRAEWTTAWRTARILKSRGVRPIERFQGADWLAQLIVWFKRTPLSDPLATPVRARLYMVKLVTEICNETA